LCELQTLWGNRLWPRFGVVNHVVLIACFTPKEKCNTKMLWRSVRNNERGGPTGVMDELVRVRGITNWRLGLHFRWNVWDILQFNLLKENLKILQPVKWLDLETLGLWLTAFGRKNLKDTWREMSWDRPSQALRIGGPGFNNQKTVYLNVLCLKVGSPNVGGVLQYIRTFVTWKFSYALYIF